MQLARDTEFYYWLKNMDRESRDKNMDGITQELVGNGHSMTVVKKVFMQMSHKCSVKVTRLTQKEIDKYTQRKKIEPPVENVLPSTSASSSSSSSSKLPDSLLENLKLDDHLKEAMVSIIEEHLKKEKERKKQKKLLKRKKEQEKHRIDDKLKRKGDDEHKSRHKDKRSKSSRSSSRSSSSSIHPLSSSQTSSESSSAVINENREQNCEGVKTVVTKDSCEKNHSVEHVEKDHRISASKPRGASVKDDHGKRKQSPNISNNIKEPIKKKSKDENDFATNKTIFGVANLNKITTEQKKKMPSKLGDEVDAIITSTSSSFDYEGCGFRNPKQLFGIPHSLSDDNDNNDKRNESQNCDSSTLLIAEPSSSVKLDSDNYDTTVSVIRDSVEKTKDEYKKTTAAITTTDTNVTNVKALLCNETVDSKRNVVEESSPKLLLTRKKKLSKKLKSFLKSSSPPPIMECINDSNVKSAKKHLTCELYGAKISQMSQILHLAVCDLAKKESTIDNAKLIESEQLLKSEMLRAERDYKYMLKVRSLEFCPLLSVMLKPGTEYYTVESVLFLYHILLTNLVKIKKKNIEYQDKLKGIILALLESGRFRDPLVNKIFKMDDDEFKTAVSVFGEINHGDNKLADNKDSSVTSNNSADSSKLLNSLLKIVVNDIGEAPPQVFDVEKLMHNMSSNKPVIVNHSRVVVDKETVKTQTLSNNNNNNTITNTNKLCTVAKLVKYNTDKNDVASVRKLMVNPVSPMNVNDNKVNNAINVNDNKVNNQVNNAMNVNDNKVNQVNNATVTVITSSGAATTTQNKQQSNDSLTKAPLIVPNKSVIDNNLSNVVNSVRNALLNKEPPTVVKNITTVVTQPSKGIANKLVLLVPSAQQQQTSKPLTRVLTSNSSSSSSNASSSITSTIPSNSKFNVATPSNPKFNVVTPSSSSSNAAIYSLGTAPPTIPSYVVNNTSSMSPPSNVINTSSTLSSRSNTIPVRDYTVKRLNKTPLNISSTTQPPAVCIPLPNRFNKMMKPGMNTIFVPASIQLVTSSNVVSSANTIAFVTATSSSKSSNVMTSANLTTAYATPPPALSTSLNVIPPANNTIGYVTSFNSSNVVPSVNAIESLTAGASTCKSSSVIPSANATAQSSYSSTSSNVILSGNTITYTDTSKSSNVVPSANNAAAYGSTIPSSSTCLNVSSANTSAYATASSLSSPKSSNVVSSGNTITYATTLPSSSTSSSNVISSANAAAYATASSSKSSNVVSPANTITYATTLPTSSNVVSLTNTTTAYATSKSSNVVSSANSIAFVTGTSTSKSSNINMSSTLPQMPKPPSSNVIPQDNTIAFDTSSNVASSANTIAYASASTTASVGPSNTAISLKISTQTPDIDKSNSIPNAPSNIVKKMPLISIKPPEKINKEYNLISQRLANEMNTNMGKILKNSCDDKNNSDTSKHIADSAPPSSMPVLDDESKHIADSAPPRSMPVLDDDNDHNALLPPPPSCPDVTNKRNESLSLSIEGKTLIVTKVVAFSGNDRNLNAKEISPLKSNCEKSGSSDDSNRIIGDKDSNEEMTTTRQIVKTPLPPSSLIPINNSMVSVLRNSAMTRINTTKISGGSSTQQRTGVVLKPTNDSLPSTVSSNVPIDQVVSQRPSPVKDNNASKKIPQPTTTRHVLPAMVNKPVKQYRPGKVCLVSPLQQPSSETGDSSTDSATNIGDKNNKVNDNSATLPDVNNISGEIQDDCNNNNNNNSANTDTDVNSEVNNISDKNEAIINDSPSGLMPLITSIMTLNHRSFSKLSKFEDKGKYDFVELRPSSISNKSSSSIRDSSRRTFVDNTSNDNSIVSSETETGSNCSNQILVDESSDENPTEPVVETGSNVSVSGGEPTTDLYLNPVAGTSTDTTMSAIESTISGKSNADASSQELSVEESPAVTVSSDDGKTTQDNNSDDDVIWVSGTVCRGKKNKSKVKRSKSANEKSVAVADDDVIILDDDDDDDVSRNDETTVQSETSVAKVVMVTDGHEVKDDKREKSEDCPKFRYFPSIKRRRKCSFSKCSNHSYHLENGNTVYLCSGCNDICYCSSVCQKIDWYTNHQINCSMAHIATKRLTTCRQ